MIGRGGMGVVLKARDTKLERVVAVKVLALQVAVSGSARQRFIREAKAAAAVRHDHVINIHAVEGDHHPPYLVMEYIHGGITVSDHIVGVTSRQTLSPPSLVVPSFECPRAETTQDATTP
jgi:serine/threonine protein kinase